MYVGEFENVEFKIFKHFLQSKNYKTRQCIPWESEGLPWGTGFGAMIL
jgi:hypothetical protein